MKDDYVIFQKLSYILDYLLNVKLDYMNTDDVNMNLLESGIGIKARELLILFFEIEKEFQITISEKDIVDGNFNTLCNIADIIYKNTIHLKETEGF